MTDDLAARLIEARAGGDHFPVWLVGAIDLPAALDLQLAVLDAELARGRALGGWKVGLTSAASRAKLGADERPFGFVLADRTLESGAIVAADELRQPSIEAEMCFTIGRDVDDPSIGPDRILDHVAAVAAGFELNEARPGTARPDFCALVTDCLTNWGIVAGDGVAASSAAELSGTRITMARNGEEVFGGVSSDHVDDHAVSLCRLAEQLGRHGRRLEAGQRVITGAFARFPIAPGERWSATFSGLGTVEAVIV